MVYVIQKDKPSNVCVFISVLESQNFGGCLSYVYVQESG
jgi:hypothetical protein